MKKIYLSVLLSFFVMLTCRAQGVDPQQAYLDSINASFTYQHGTVSLKGGVANITVPTGFKYLDAQQSRQVLVDLWGNPPDDSSLGMLFPEGDGPMTDKSYAINITYSEDGYIKDDDASKIDYADLLKEMQADTEEANEYRAENGYETVALIGWAVTPHYDQASHKLHWAKELRFAGQEANTLNYNIRILGRKGYLMLNAIGEMALLPEVQQSIPQVLASVNFNEGNRYIDFDPSLDQVAAYGIGGLIAGKVLTKLGFLALLAKYFKVLLVLLLKFWKVVAIALVGLGMGIKKFFSRKEEEPTYYTKDAEDEPVENPEEAPVPALSATAIQAEDAVPLVEEDLLPKA